MPLASTDVFPRSAQEPARSDTAQSNDVLVAEISRPAAPGAVGDLLHLKARGLAPLHKILFRQAGRSLRELGVEHPEVSCRGHCQRALACLYQPGRFRINEKCRDYGCPA